MWKPLLMVDDTSFVFAVDIFVWTLVFRSLTPQPDGARRRVVMSCSSHNYTEVWVKGKRSEG